MLFAKHVKLFHCKSTIAEMNKLSLSKIEFQHNNMWIISWTQFVRCGKSAMENNFIFYQGKGTGIRNQELGLGGSCVMRLVENLPENTNFGNFFTSVPLLLELKVKGVFSLAVLKTNPMSSIVLKSKIWSMRVEALWTVVYLNLEM